MRNGAWRTVTRVCKKISAEFPSCAPSNLAHLERFVIIVDASSAEEAWLSFECTWKNPRSRGPGIDHTLALEIADLESGYAKPLTTSVQTARYVDIRLVGPGGERGGDNHDDLATLLMMFVKFSDALIFLKRIGRWLYASPRPLMSLSFENGPLATGPGQSAFWTSQFSALRDLVPRLRGPFKPQGATLYAYEYFLPNGARAGLWLPTKITLPPFLPETCSILTSGCSTLTKLEPGHEAERTEADETYRRGLVSELALQRWWDDLCESAASEFARWVGDWPYDQVDWTSACMMEMFHHLTYHQSLLKQNVAYFINRLPGPEGGPIRLLRRHHYRAEVKYANWCREAESVYMARSRLGSSAQNLAAVREQVDRIYSVSRFTSFHSWRGFFYAAKDYSLTAGDDGVMIRDVLIRVLSQGRQYTEPGYFRRTIYRGRTIARLLLSDFLDYQDRERALL